MPYCPNCGHEIEERDRFCIQCGEPVEDRVPSSGGTYGQDAHSQPTVDPEGRLPDRAAFTAGTRWGPVAVAVIGILQSLYFVLAPEQIIEAAGFGPELTTGVVVATGALGLVMSLGVLGLVYYYNGLGHVDGRYFWLLIGLGIAGFFLGGGIAFLLLILLGAYGHVSVLS